jgi:hypothetical protein
MTPIRDIPVGTLVFLECGCSCVRGVSQTGSTVAVVVYDACADHGGAKGNIRSIDHWGLVRPVRKER